MVSILNSILTSLMTENEVITNIIIVPLAFIEIFISMLLFTQLLNIRSTNTQKLIYVITLSTFSIYINIFVPRHIAVFINMLIYPLAIIIVFKTTILKAIIAELVPILIIVLIETIIVNLYYVILNISYNTLLTIPFFRISSLLLIYLLLLIFYLNLKKLKLNIYIFDNYDPKNRMVLIAEAALGIASIGLQFYLIMFYAKNLPLLVSIFSISTVFIYFIFNMYTLTRITTLEITKLNLEESKLYNKTLQLLHDNVRAFRHDFSNIIAGIGGYVQTNDMEGLSKYYSQLLIDCQCTNNLTTLSPVLINNPAIYNVLANKYHRADEKGIKIELSIFYDFNKLNIKIYELTRILGILLDNAIEASCECDKKFINLIIRDEEKNKRQVVLIENTYLDKNINTEKIFEKGFSTKEGNTGLGLWQIRQILKKNNNLNLYTSKNNEYFSQSLEIYNT